MFGCLIILDDELFPIKMFYDGEMVNNPKRYTSDLLVYLELCHSNALSLLEIKSMHIEFRSKCGFYELWFKIPETTMEKGLFELESDGDLMLMCALLNNK